MEAGMACSLDDVVNSLFDKMFPLKLPNDSFEVPSCTSYFSGVVEEVAWLTLLKSRLNEAKSKLSNKDIGIWHSHTTFTNPAGEVVRRCRAQYNGELCTQAWIKFYEILCRFEGLLNCDSSSLEKQFCSMHLCEAPGAFICALNHFMEAQEIKLKWDWYATTLNPYYEGHSIAQMIADDRLIITSSNRWLFGQDNTGDLFKRQNLEELCDKFSGNCGLVTADGSTDCQDDPAEQEKMTFSLHYCEVVSALHLLKIGGCFVLKIFTTFEHCTLALLYLICCHFEKVHLFKPATSKSGNSEQYLICEQFLGADKQFLSCLDQKYGKKVFTTPLFPLNCISSTFLRRISDAAETLANCQLNMINFNVESFRPEEKVSNNHCVDNDSNDHSEKLSKKVDHVYKSKFKPGPQWTKSELLPLIGAAKRATTTRFFEVYRQKLSRLSSDNQKIIPFALRECLDENRKWFSFALLSGNRLEAGNFSDRSLAIQDSECLRHYLKGVRHRLTQFAAKFCLHQPLEQHLTDYNGSTLLNAVEFFTVSNWIPAVAQSPLVVCSSKFLDVDLLRLFTQLIDMVLEKEHIRSAIECLELYNNCALIMDNDDLPCVTSGASSVSKLEIQLNPCTSQNKNNSEVKLTWISWLLTVVLSHLPEGSEVILRGKFLVLTRFSAGIVAILALCFRSLHFSTNFAGQTEIILKEHRGVCSHLLLHIQKIKCICESLSLDQEFLEILPMSFFFEPTLYNALWLHNSRLLTRVLLETLAIEENEDI